MHDNLLSLRGKNQWSPALLNLYTESEGGICSCLILSAVPNLCHSDGSSRHFRPNACRKFTLEVGNCRKCIRATTFCRHYSRFTATTCGHRCETFNNLDPSDSFSLAMVHSPGFMVGSCKAFINVTLLWTSSIFSKARGYSCKDASIRQSHCSAAWRPDEFLRPSSIGYVEKM